MGQKEDLVDIELRRELLTLYEKLKNKVKSEDGKDS